MPIDRLSKIKALIQDNHKRAFLPQFWKPTVLISRITPSKSIQAWLKTPSSLTIKLRVLCPDLRVVVLSETMEIPLLNEREKLGMQADEQAWVRCVLLKCANKNWVYARTIIPNFIAKNPWYDVQYLGTKPLGEVLFENAGIWRSEFEFSSNKLDYWPYLVDNLANKDQLTRPGFARRSLFKQQNASLLLTEVFLPGLVDSKNA